MTREKEHYDVVLARIPSQLFQYLQDPRFVGLSVA
jgi:hypothetical protein